MRLLAFAGLPLALVVLFLTALALQIMRARARRGPDGSEARDEAGPGLHRNPTTRTIQTTYVRSRASPIAILLGLLSLAAGGGVFYVLELQPVRDRVASRSWVATPCTISYSDVEKYVDHDDDTMSRVSIRYGYEFGGHQFEGDRYAFGAEGFSSGDEKQRIAAALPPGTHRTCYVDPQQPRRSVLERRLHDGFVWISGACAFFAVAGVGILATALPSARKTEG